MVRRSPDFNAFEFVVVATLRTAQLVRGCTPRVEAADKPVVTAQREVASGAVRGLRLVLPVASTA